MTQNPLKLQLQDLTFQQAQQKNPLVNDLPIPPSITATSGAADKAAMNSDAVALRARQHAHRMETIAQLQADHAKMSAEMEELTQLLIPQAHTKGSEEEKEAPDSAQSPYHVAGEDDPLTSPSSSSPPVLPPRPQRSPRDGMETE